MYIYLHFFIQNYWGVALLLVCVLSRNLCTKCLLLGYNKSSVKIHLVLVNACRYSKLRFFHVLAIMNFKIFLLYWIVVQNKFFFFISKLTLAMKFSGKRKIIKEMQLLVSFFFFFKYIEDHLPSIPSNRMWTHNSRMHCLQFTSFLHTHISFFLSLYTFCWQEMYVYKCSFF